MLLPLLLSLSFGTTLAELKLDPRKSDYLVIETLTEGFRYIPISRYSTQVVNLLELSADARAALTREGLEVVKAYVMSEQGREAWKKRLAQRPAQPFAERAAGVASEVTYWSTLVKESRKKDESAQAQLERATLAAAAFKNDRARLQREELTREKAAAALDEAAFKAQLKERLTLFLDETKVIPWNAALVEKNGVKRFADVKLEAKEKWWKLCFRAGPEATNAAREVATTWLAELNAPPSPSRLSDEK